MEKIVFKSSTNNYEALVDKLSQMFADSGYIVIKNTRPTPCTCTNRKNIEKIIGDAKYSEIKECARLINSMFD